MSRRANLAQRVWLRTSSEKEQKFLRIASRLAGILQIAAKTSI
jgi:hypothetical protein